MIETNTPAKPTTTHFEKEPSLSELQKVVGGYIEGVRTMDGRMLYVNEDGHMLELELNETATNLVGWLIVGNAALIGGKAP
tara:strand:+ start:2440 stop:2682 length:243 start_codon:yes stop_codon:yes gene_type:complete